jgi:oligopeptide transport system permease protein
MNGVDRSAIDAPPAGTRRGSLLGVCGGAVVIFMLLACLTSLPYTLGRAAPGSAQRRYEATNTAQSLLPPFWSHYKTDERDRVAVIQREGGAAPRSWLGTDRLGRSVLARCLLGGAISLGVGLSAAAIAVIIGTLYGTISGWCGGKIDALMMRIVDVLYGLPYILLVVLLAVAIDGIVTRPNAASMQATGLVQWLLPADRQTLNLLTLLIAIGGVSWLTMARVIRGQVLSLKSQLFMEACRSIGVPLRRQFMRHLLPNLAGPIIVYATLTVPVAILSESFLSFLGIGVQEPLPSWGNLAAAGLSELNTVRMRWWLLLWPCVFIAATLLGLNFAGEALRERFDPKRLPR